ncbi:MAG: response regulator [Verrucomicrobiota bacterium]
MSREKTKVLVIDDESDYTDLVVLNLIDKGYDAEALNDGTLAVEKAREYEPDVILLDMIMPKIDGGDVLGNLKRIPELSRIPVLFVSALGDEGQNDDTGIIPKPTSFEYLVKRIEGAIDTEHDWKE